MATTKAVSNYIFAWKSSLTTELVNLEENLNQLFQFIGVSSNKIIGTNKADNEEELDEGKSDFETIINEHLHQANLATHNICTLITTPTDFDLPVPVNILMRIAAKAGSIRWKDYKKRPNGLIRSHVYSLTPKLVKINLMIFKTVVTILGTNVIPFTPFINLSLFKILEWTRTSNLEESVYHSMRIELLETLTFMIEQLSLNIGLEPTLLKTLIETELVDNLESLWPLLKGGDSLMENHVVKSLKCLEDISVAYSGFLEPSLEEKLKGYVIQTCIKIYRDFEANVSSIECRRNLLYLLQTLANQPYASSTTEISAHIFELADKIESDLDIKAVIRRSLRLGLAHRPTIVTQNDVYSCYYRPMSTVVEKQRVQDQPNDQHQQQDQQEQQQDQQQQQQQNQQQKQDQHQQQDQQNQQQDQQEQQQDQQQQQQQNQQQKQDQQQQQEQQYQLQSEQQDRQQQVQQEQHQQKEQQEQQEKVSEQSQQVVEQQADGDESVVLSYMSYFVEKLA